MLDGDLDYLLIVAEILEEFGYEVSTYCDPNPTILTDCDLIISDYPDLSTNYPGPIIHTHFRSSITKERLIKPFSCNQLISKIKKLIH